MAVTGHHARLGTRLRAKLCRGHYFKRLNSISFQGTTLHRSGQAAFPGQMCWTTFDLLCGLPIYVVLRP